jgi:tetratricopeptide (TPR) repeat protein
LGCAYAHCGRISEAIPYLEQGVEDFESTGRAAFLSLSTVWLGEGYLLAGRVAEARACIERALELARTHKERGHEAWGLKLLGDIALHHTPPKTAEAESCYRRAFALSVELGMRPLEAHCRFALSRADTVIGVAPPGREELRAVADLYRAMEMTNWLARVEQALENVSV